MFEDWFRRHFFIAWPCLHQLNQQKGTSSHTTINLHEFSIFIEWNSRTFLTSSNKSAYHDRVGTYCKCLAHVSWIFVSSVRAEGNIIIWANWCSVHEGWKLRNSTSGHYSRDANTAISDAAANTICSTSDQTLCAFSSGDWSWHDVDGWKPIFELFGCLHCDLWVTVCHVNNQHIASWFD